MTIAIAHSPGPAMNSRGIELIATIRDLLPMVSPTHATS